MIPDAPLPHAVSSGAEPLLAAAAMAGGSRQAMFDVAAFPIPSIS